MSKLIRILALSSMGVLTLSGASCIGVGDCSPEKSSDGYNTGRMKCNIGQKGGQYAVQTAMEDSSLSPMLAWVTRVFTVGLMAQQSTPINIATFDATLVRLSTLGSTVAPSSNSGVFAISLYQGTTLVAVQSFDWIRNGSDLIIANPGAMNAWVGQYPQANGYAFGGDLTFQQTAAPTTTIQTSHIYGQTVTSSTSATYSSPRPGGSRGSVQEQ